jgi:hypothetical protein
VPDCFGRRQRAEAQALEYYLIARGIEQLAALYPEASERCANTRRRSISARIGPIRPRSRIARTRVAIAAASGAPEPSNQRKIATKRQPRACKRQFIPQHGLRKCTTGPKSAQISYTLRSETDPVKLRAPALKIVIKQRNLLWILNPRRRRNDSLQRLAEESRGWTRGLRPNQSDPVPV